MEDTRADMTATVFIQSYRSADCPVDPQARARVCAEGDAALKAFLEKMPRTFAEDAALCALLVKSHRLAQTQSQSDIRGFPATFVFGKFAQLGKAELYPPKNLKRWAWGETAGVRLVGNFKFGFIGVINDSNRSVGAIHESPVFYVVLGGRFVNRPYKSFVHPFDKPKFERFSHLQPPREYRAIPRYLLTISPKCATMNLPHNCIIKSANGEDALAKSVFSLSLYLLLHEGGLCNCVVTM